MKVIVFGATGSVGQLAVERLLASGHTVTAFARQPDRLELRHARLVTRTGDALDPDSVRAAVDGHDAVIIALGAGASRKSRVRSQGTLNVINAMQAHGVTRLICQSTLGVGDSWANLNFMWKRIMFGLLLKPAFEDHVLQEQLVRASGLDWTIVRPSAFTDDAPGDDYKVDFPASERGLSLKIARAEVAAFLAKCLGETPFTHRAVAISH